MYFKTYNIIQISVSVSAAKLCNIFPIEPLVFRTDTIKLHKATIQLTEIANVFTHR